MKRRSLPLLIACLGLMPVALLRAQTFITLHSFSKVSSDFFCCYTNSDGAGPVAGLVLSNNTLYGTAEGGGTSGNGTVFALNVEGKGFTNLHSFTEPSAFGTNNDGAIPRAGLVLSGNTLYGTAEYGGRSGNGTVFKINTDGTGFTNLHSFSKVSSDFFCCYTNSDGAGPRADLIISGNTLYGCTSEGGTSGKGTVFALNTNGTGFTNLHSFGGIDGVGPRGSLVLSSNTLYGTTWGRGVFSLHIDGTGFTNLYNFTAIAVAGGSNGDGAESYAGLILSGKTLFGTASRGGGFDSGTLFAINTDGTGFTNLHNFAGFPDEGARPFAGLVLSGNSLYGTTVIGGSSGCGTVFAVSTNGTGFTNLYNFTNGDGAIPLANLVLSGNTLYGTTSSGGDWESGTVFSLSFRPRLTFIPSEVAIVLRWPTNNAGFDYTGFTLQSTTDLVSSATWTNVSPEPVVVNGQSTVTNPITGARRFYRLSQ